MRQHDQSEILVVGAGPVGMFTALRLAENGISVQLIDQESRTAGRSYACALHPRTLQLLDEAGVAGDAIRLGKRMETVAFYENADRRAELDLSRLPVEFPFVLVLEQKTLEDLLERKLRERAGLEVRWNHRLADLVPEGDSVACRIEELAMDGKGYIVPDLELEVKKNVSARAEYVVGTDGQNSVVRHRLDIDCERAGEAQFFTVYELETEASLPPEIRIALHRQTVSVLWPFTENKCRWSFQWFRADAPVDFPEKDRGRFILAESQGNKDKRHRLERLLRARAPWFKAGIKSVGWAADIQFEHRLTQQFGRGRAWLAGDSAHQTGPVGMQSMNMGFREGADLAARLTRILREKEPPNLLQAYNLQQRTEWGQLLGLTGTLNAGSATDAWVREHCVKLPSYIPASGKELSLLLSQLGLEFECDGLHEVAA